MFNGFHVGAHGATVISNAILPFKIVANKSDTVNNESQKMALAIINKLEAGFSPNRGPPLDAAAKGGPPEAGRLRKNIRKTKKESINIHTRKVIRQ